MAIMARRTLVRLLEDNDFRYWQSRGGHDYYPKGSVKVTVPHHSKDIEDPVLSDILSQAGLR